MTSPTAVIPARMAQCKEALGDYAPVIGLGLYSSSPLACVGSEPA